MTSLKNPTRVPLVRKKVWHHKTRTGCYACRLKRVRCDEAQPTCKRCLRCGAPCKYPPKWFNMAIPISLPEANLDMDMFPLGCRDFQFYLCTGAPMIAQWQCPSFWLTTLPTASTLSSAIKCAMLAMSITTQQFMSTSPDAIQEVANRGDIYYGRACSMLRFGSGSTVTVEEALSASFTLWCYDWFFGRQQQSFVHANAAVKLFRSLENDDTTFGSSALTTSSHNSMIELARAFFRDMHFPVENSEFLRMLERRTRPGNETNLECDVVRWPLPLRNPFAELTTPKYINSFFWLTIVADSKQALYTIQQALDHCAYQCANETFPRSREQETFKNQICLFQLFCEMHLCDIQDRDEEDNDDLMSEMLNLIQANMQLLADEDSSSHSSQQDASCSGVGQQGIHCYLGVLGLVGQQAHDAAIRLRAFGLIMLHGMPGS